MLFEYLKNKYNLAALMGDTERGAVTFYENGIELPRGDNFAEL